MVPKHGLEPAAAKPYRTLLNSDQVQLVYLEDLQAQPYLPLTLGVLQLVIEPTTTAIERARQLRQQAKQQTEQPFVPVIIELIETTMIYKCPQMSRQEVEAMLGLVDDVKQTRVYQEAR